MDSGRLQIAADYIAGARTSLLAFFDDVGTGRARKRAGVEAGGGDGGGAAVHCEGAYGLVGASDFCQPPPSVLYSCTTAVWVLRRADVRFSSAANNWRSASSTLL